MPSFPCKWPTCTAYVGKRGEYCQEHAEHGRRERADRNKFYDQHIRDPEARKFYDSAAWQRARATKLANEPVCERCRRAWAQHVHHRIPLKSCPPKQRTDQKILMSVCQPCHNAIEKES